MNSPDEEGVAEATEVVEQEQQMMEEAQGEQRIMEEEQAEMEEEK